MRLTITIAATPGGWDATFDPDPAGLGVRQLEKVGELPAPPAAERGALPADLQAPAAGQAPPALLALAASLRTRAPGANDVERMGRYLFTTLIGTPRWNAVVAAAAGGRLDLVLKWRATDWRLTSLYWEMMHSGAEFLAQMRAPEVTVTRHPMAAAGAPPPAGTPGGPLRVLFVVGVDLNEPVIHPGAEYLPLLRRLRENGLGLNNRILMAATRTRVIDAVSAFRPTVVHFICHGDWGRVFLRPEPGAAAAGADDPCNADALVSMLAPQPGMALPAIVVLNACDTGGQPVTLHAPPPGQDPPPPLAVALVEKGVPLVAAMAGRVSDAAARLFTRRFYEALIEGSTRRAADPGVLAASPNGGTHVVDVAAAAAEGRRAAFRMDKFPRQSVDWALPVLVARDGLAPEVEITDLARAYLEEDAARSYRGGFVLCDRLDAMSPYQAWLQQVSQPAPPGKAAPKRVFALVEKVERSDPADKYGATLMLESFALHAIQAGFAPCLVKFTGVEEPPGTLLKLARAIVDAAGATRDNFGAPAAGHSHVRDLQLRAEQPAHPVHPSVANELVGGVSPQNPRPVAAALKLDLADLKAALDGVGGRPVMVFLDHAHRCNPAVGDLEKLLSKHGLGTSEAPVPLVFTCQVPKMLGEPLANLLGREWVEKCTCELGPFTHVRMAYQDYLLSFCPPPTFAPPQRLVVRPDADPADVESLFETMHEYVQGVPSRLITSPDLRVLVRAARNFRVLVPADDEDLLRRLHDGGGG